MDVYYHSKVRLVGLIYPPTLSMGFSETRDSDGVKINRAINLNIFVNVLCSILFHNHLSRASWFFNEVRHNWPLLHNFIQKKYLKGVEKWTMGILLEIDKDYYQKNFRNGISVMLLGLMLSTTQIVTIQ